MAAAAAAALRADAGTPQGRRFQIERVSVCSVPSPLPPSPSPLPVEPEPDDDAAAAAATPAGFVPAITIAAELGARDVDIAAGEAELEDTEGEGSSLVAPDDAADAANADADGEDLALFSFSSSACSALASAFAAALRCLLATSASSSEESE